MGVTAVIAGTSAVEYGDVQGLVRFAYKHLTEACYLLLRIADAQSARAWLATAPVASAADAFPPPTTALQVAFTAAGLRALGMLDDAVAQFSAEFVSGMAGDENRSRRLGDLGANAPANWSWGTGAREPHLVAALFAAPGGLDAFARALQTNAWRQAFELVTRLDTSDLNGVEQFGFTDGISQPTLDWKQERVLRGDKPDYGDVVALGEFLLGYPNEYDCYTERPLVGDDLARNGTYAVIRDLRQDVRAFWSFAKSDDLAAKMVGRRRNGDPLVPVAETSQNLFTYAGDPGGTRCPFGAHIRRANPRNADFPSVPSGPIATGLQMLGLRKSAFHDDLTSSVRFHRILRRGREYGPGLSPEEAQSPPLSAEPARGLRFVCLNANIGRQFEFLQNAWLAGDTFNGMIGESDPLLGSREPGFAGEPAD
ncbi:MAG: peroxidase, partial [Candidatus Eremiobacteraeota bacterium]|nr:peroxidase [Candidatus Eremiobacteraeota bacterium]